MQHAALVKLHRGQTTFTKAPLSLKYGNWAEKQCRAQIKQSAACSFSKGEEYLPVCASILLLKHLLQDSVLNDKN